MKAFFKTIAMVMTVFSVLTACQSTSKTQSADNKLSSSATERSISSEERESFSCVILSNSQPIFVFTYIHDNGPQGTVSRQPLTAQGCFAGSDQEVVPTKVEFEPVALGFSARVTFSIPTLERSYEMAYKKDATQNIQYLTVFKVDENTNRVLKEYVGSEIECLEEIYSVGSLCGAGH